MWTYRRLIGAFAAVLLAIGAFSSAAFAGTTGVISGKVTVAQSGTPLAGVKVSAVAPTGTYTATTNSTGFYSMFGVNADTYTLTFTASGYDPYTVQGVNVFADQSASVDASLRPATKTLGKEVVRGVSGGAYQPKQTVDTYTVTQAQINNIQGNALNISETNLITSLPGAAADANGYPTIRGGRENEEGFQFEGIPYTDAFTNQFVNTLATPGLGLLNVQLTPGAGSAAFGNSGTGTLNLIARRGTYPAFSSAQLAAGGGQFYHAGNFDYGTAAADGRWSNYFAFSGSNTGFTYGNINGPPAKYIGAMFSTLMEVDREFINNFTYRFGSNNTKSVQLFYDDAQHEFYQGYGGNPFCFPGCDAEYGASVNGLLGALGSSISQDQLASITGFVPYQSNQNELLASQNRAPGTYYQPNHAIKLQFDDNVNSTTFVSAKYYQVNAVTTFDFPAWEEFGGSIQQGGFTNGVTADMTSQLGDKNLLKIGADYAYLRPVYDQPGPGQGIISTLFGGGDTVTGLGAFEFLDFLPNDANCPFGLGACGYLSAYLPSLPARVPQNLEQSITTRQDFSLYIDDTISATPKLQIEPGLRFDGANYRMPTPGVDPATCTTLYEPATWNTNVKSGCPIATFNVTNDQIRPRIPEPRIAMSYELTGNDALRFSYGRSVEFPPLGQVDLYDPPSAYSPYSKIPSYDSLGFLFTGSAMPAQCGIPGFQVQCKNYGEQLYWENQNTYQGVPLQPVKPELFDNYDFSYSHQFTDGFAFKVTPWYRRGYDATASVQAPIIVNGQPVSNGAGGFQFYPPVVTNKGTNHATGVELLVTKEAAQGWSGQFTATYINEFSNVIPLSGSEDFFPSIPPPSLLLNNLYRVGYLSPFQTSLDLNYQRNGWRFSPQITYNVGYPNGAGLYAAAFINGVPYNLLNTNASGLINAAPNGTILYIDPMDPGSYFNPHVAATRGTPEGTWPGGKLDHPQTAANFTLEYNLKHNQVLGFTMNNVFNSIYSGPVLNARYQPVATGFSGPLSGLHNPPFYPGLGQYNYGGIIRGQNAYVNRPDATPRNYYFYFQLKV